MNGIDKLIDELPPKSYKLGEPMARHTTVGIGGPADIWYEAGTSQDLIGAVKLAKKYQVPVTILGWGSNVLVGDKGIRGLVIHNASSEVVILEKSNAPSDPRDGSWRAESNAPSDPPLNLRGGRGSYKETVSRWQADKEKGSFKYDFSDLNYDENDKEKAEVIVDSGVSLPFLINYTIYHGVTGLQWFAGIPGTVGGAIYNNIHGGTRLFAEVVREVTVLTEGRKIMTLRNCELGLGYDRSRFQQSGELIVKARLQLFKGDKVRAKKTAAEWARRKKIQPRATPGCVFKNISNEEKERLGYPTTAVGYIIEHVLEMGGFRIGEAVISTAHHNFIVNAGGATARDYRAVINEIQRRTKNKIGIELAPEIFLLGEF